MADAINPSTYLPTVNAMALDSSTWQWGDGALANSFGTVAQASGTDAAAGVNTALVTPPETKRFDLSDYLVIGSDAVAKKKAQLAAQGATDSGSFKPYFYGAIAVVIGILVISRGFGLLGEQGESVAVSLANPAKYPGIGHAVQSLKRK